MKTSARIWASLKRGSVIVLAIIGAGAVVQLFALPFLLHAILGKDLVEPEVIRVLYSPNKQYKAVLSNENGGGGISPYCHDFISVVPSYLPDALAKTDSYRVYTASCHSLGFSYRQAGQPVLETAPLLKWTSDFELEITFDPTAAASGNIDHSTFHGYSRSGGIRIVYKQFLEHGRDAARPNTRFDTDPQQQRFAPLARAGQSPRWASRAGGCIDYASAKEVT